MGESSLRQSQLVGGWAEDGIDEVLDALSGVEGEQWFEFDDYGIEKLAEYVPEKMRAAGELIREEYSDRAVTLGAGNAMVWLPSVMGPEVKKESSRTGSMGEMIAGLKREEKPILARGYGEFEMDLSINNHHLERPTGPCDRDTGGEIGQDTDPQAELC
ncbi:MAG: hypothetical protein ABEJ69_02725 [Candidatus Nanohaloarchaea archaeon]